MKIIYFLKISHEQKSTSDSQVINSAKLIIACSQLYSTTVAAGSVIGVISLITLFSNESL